MPQLLITPGLSAMLRHQAGQVFWHTYSRTPRTAVPDNPSTIGTDESLDDWGEQVYNPVAAIPLQPCMFVDAGQTLIGPNGLIEISRPTLLVPNTDPIQEGDVISNVRTLDAAGSILLLAGPVRIEEVTQVAPQFGGAIYKTALLRVSADI